MTRHAEHGKRNSGCTDLLESVDQQLNFGSFEDPKSYNMLTSTSAIAF